MRLSKIDVKILSKTKSECIDKIGYMNTLKNIKTIDVTPTELANLINNGYSICNAIFENKFLSKKPVWKVWDNDKSKRKQATDENGNLLYKETYNRTVENVSEINTISFDLENEYSLPYPIEEIRRDLQLRNLDNFSVIYETYSHGIKGDRYRLVGTLSRPVNAEEYSILYEYVFATFVRKNIDMAVNKAGVKYDNIHLADFTCRDISKINFPGKVIYVNNENVINVDKLLERIKNEDFKFEDRQIIKDKKFNITKTKKVKEKKEKPENNDNLLTVGAILDYLYSLGEVEIDYNYRYMILQDMVKISDLICEEVGDNNLFCCVLPNHHEENGSAHIYIDPVDGCEKYHCWGCNSRFNSIQFVKHIFESELGQMTDLQFFRFIEDNTQVKFGTLYQKESYAHLCAIQDKLYNVRCEKEDKNFKKAENKVLKKRGVEIEVKRRKRRSNVEIKEEILFNYLSNKKLLTFYTNLMTIARNNISINPLVADDYNRFSFFQGISSLEDKMNKIGDAKYSRSKIQDGLKALAKVGIIEYASIDKLSDNARKNAIEYKKKNNQVNHVNFFIINNILDLETLINVTNAIEELKTLRNKSVRDMTYEQVYRDFGKEKADKMYPQRKGKEIELEDKNYKHIVEVINKLLIENGNYFTEAMLKARMSKRLKVKEKEALIKKYINQVIKDLEISYTKANKKVRDDFPEIPNTITNKQYVYVKY